MLFENVTLKEQTELQGRNQRITEFYAISTTSFYYGGRTTNWQRIYLVHL